MSNKINETDVTAFLDTAWKNFKIPLVKDNVEPISVLMNNGQVKLEPLMSDSLSESVASPTPTSSKNNFLMVSPLAVNEVTPMVDSDSLPKYGSSHIVPLASNNSTTPNGKKRKVADAGYVVSQHVRSMGQLPTDLTKLFLPLFCELCGIHSNSPISARAHYTSVGHDKKIKAWLLKREQEMSEPSQKKSKLQDTKLIELHCNICDVPLSSAAMANQHYSGKKHLSALHSSNLAGNKTTADTVDSSTSAVSASLASIVQPNADVFCAICNISVSSKDEMPNHLKGSRHAKRLRAAGIAPYTPNADTDTIVQCVRSSIIELLPTIKEMQRDTSVNRTPSGHFYCKTCNVTLDTEVMFMQHLDSKRHRKQHK